MLRCKQQFKGNQFVTWLLLFYLTDIKIITSNPFVQKFVKKFHALTYRHFDNTDSKSYGT